MTGKLADRTMVISGGSRGIGLAIAVAAAAEGANIVLLAKTATADPRLPGTIYTAAAEIEATGGKAFPVVGDVRRDESVAAAVEAAVAQFGGIDICVNNASAISLEGTLDLAPKRFDLMQTVNVRGTWALTRACLPHLRKSRSAHVLTLSPPLNLNPRWLGAYPAYTLSKYGMTMLTLGWATEFADQGIGFNCLWPQTLIDTAAVRNVVAGAQGAARARSPKIMADAAIAMLTRDPRTYTGRCEVDATVVAAAGVEDLTIYGGGENPERDLFLDD
ncbi:SDR family oxidoreductase [Amycolatopsis thermophila]|uniref:NAD(P)-dependent dehydrogenase (Short-subunit alcohol dehydrogenase family) n=1 Tax=Amycolatopsis thermophila TaxID=206084 RepID=A0ABU0F5C3_9PSEU|nr:NAD(P)-dependent oxidoreductase [Amycolatopsis thermophila]MDQ0382787.1 NAD(P)-dependent dehydrogenase (short-subunit alcohol dehydrogenase family) [Amycolatopsis thermophila]